MRLDKSDQLTFCARLTLYICKTRVRFSIELCVGGGRIGLRENYVLPQHQFHPELCRAPSCIHVLL